MFGLKMARDSITYVGTQLVDIIPVGKDGFTQSSCCVASFNGLFNQKDYLVHQPNYSRGCIQGGFNLEV